MKKNWEKSKIGSSLVAIYQSCEIIAGYKFTHAQYVQTVTIL